MTLNKTYLVGLTGGIASGKSTVSKYLEEKGIIVIDADILARKVVERGSEALKEIEKEFGHEVITPNGELNRPVLGKIIFEDEDLKEKLNKIVHPAIFLLLKEILSKQDNKKLVFIDMALLVENIDNMRTHGIYLDEIWSVSLPLEVQINRLMNRDKISYEYAKNKINSQISSEERNRFANIIIDNSLGEENLRKKVDAYLEDLYTRLSNWRKDEKD